MPFACRHWTESTQSAISILGAISSVINLVLALPGGYIGDRVQRKPLLFLFAVIGAPLSLIYLLAVPFAAVIILSVYVRAFERTRLLLPVRSNLDMR